MVTFSINQTTDPSIVALLWQCILRNEGMIAKRILSSVNGQVPNRSEVIKEKIDTIKEDVWFKTVMNFRADVSDDSLPIAEQAERYVKVTLSKTLDDCLSTKSRTVPFDFDLLDGNRSTVEGDRGKKELPELLSSVAKSTVHVATLEYNIKLSEFRRLVAEIYLSDRHLYDVLDSLVQYCSELNREKLRSDLKYARNKRSDRMVARFLEYLGVLNLPDVENIFRTFGNYEKKLSPKEKNITIKDYAFYEYEEPSSIYRGVIQQGGKLVKYDWNRCKLDKVDLEATVCKLLNSTSHSVYRIRVEDYLDYAEYQTTVEEGVNTELIHWIEDFYMYTLPSGRNIGFCIDPSEYKIKVKQELVANLLKNGVSHIFAMTDSYVYFTPKIKPKYSTINVTLFNGKVIKMKVEGVYNVYT